MTINFTKNIVPYTSPISLKLGNSRLLNRKKVIQAFYSYSGLLLEDYFCTLFFGTILFDSALPAEQVWSNVDTALKKLQETLFKQSNVADVWVAVEVHRSRSDRVNHLAGRPHLHFIVSYTCHKYLGPTSARLLTILRSLFYDVTIKPVKATRKDYLRIFRYLWKDSCYLDVSSLLTYYKQSSTPYSFWIGSTDLLPDAKQVFITLNECYPEMVGIKNCLNQYCFHVSPDASLDLIVTKVIWHTLRVTGYLCIGDTVYVRRSEKHKHAYVPIAAWDDFVRLHLQTVRLMYYPLEAAIDKVVNSGYKIAANFPQLTLHHRFIEATDGTYDLEKDRFQLAKDFNPPVTPMDRKKLWFRNDNQFHMRQAFDMPLADIFDDEQELNQRNKVYDSWLESNDINPALFKTIMGSLLHKRCFARDLGTPVLSGQSGAGKSLVCRLYADLVGREFVGEISTAGRFAFQSIVNKVLTLIDDAEWKQSPQQLKLLLEGATFKTEKKYGGMVQVDPHRTVVTTQSPTFSYIFEDQHNAVAFEARCHRFNFIKELDHEKAEELIEAFPAFAISANRAYLKLKKNDFSKAFLDELTKNWKN